MPNTFYHSEVKGYPFGPPPPPPQKKERDYYYIRGALLIYNLLLKF